MHGWGTGTYISDLGTGKPGECIRSIRGRNQSGLAKVVLGLQIANLGFVWSIHDAHGNGKHSIALLQLLVKRVFATELFDHPDLGFLSNGFVNDVVVFDDFFLNGIRQILHAGLFLLQVDVA